jgi:hypothetical protein
MSRTSITSAFLKSFVNVIVGKLNFYLLRSKTCILLSNYSFRKRFSVIKMKETSKAKTLCVNVSQMQRPLTGVILADTNHRVVLVVQIIGSN